MDDEQTAQLDGQAVHDEQVESATNPDEHEQVPAVDE